MTFASCIKVKKVTVPQSCAIPKSPASPRVSAPSSSRHSSPKLGVPRIPRVWRTNPSFDLRGRRLSRCASKGVTKTTAPGVAGAGISHARRNSNDTSFCESVRSATTRRRRTRRPSSSRLFGREKSRGCGVCVRILECIGSIRLGRGWGFRVWRTRVRVLGFRV